MRNYLKKKNLNLNIFSVFFLAIFLFLSFFNSQKVKASDHTTTLYPVADAEVYSLTPLQNFGSTPHLEVGHSILNGGDRYSMVRFDLSTVPANATITSAQFSLYLTQCDGSMNPNELRIGQITINWVENQVTWHTSPNFIPGTSHSGSCGGQNWWRYNATQIVQNWQAGQNNYGFFVYSIANTDYLRQFNSREYGGLPNQPQLLINFSLPDPTLTPTNETAQPTANPSTPPVSNDPDNPQPSGDVAPTTDGTVPIPTDIFDLIPAGEFDPNTFAPFLSPILETIGLSGLSLLIPCVVLCCCCLLLIILLIVVIKLLGNKNKTEKPVAASTAPQAPAETPVVAKPTIADKPVEPTIKVSTAETAKSKEKKQTKED